MPTMDMPHIPQHQMPVVLAAQTTQPSIEKLYGSIGVCTVADKTDQAEREKKLGVRLYASTIFDHKNPHYRAYYESIYAHAEDKSLLEDAVRNKEIDYRFIRDKNATVTVLEQPEHGNLTSVRDKKSRQIFEKQEKYRLRHPFFPQKPAHHEINTIVLRCR
jgi:hypothetical protein